MVGGAFDRQGWLAVSGLLFPFTVAVRLVAERAAMVAIHAHRAVPVVTMDGAARSVHWDLMMIDAEAVALRVPVREESGLQHLVR